MLPGQLVGDRFEVERPVAFGGMGAVFRARDRQTGEPVALKVLLGHGPGDAERFAREARVLEGMVHPAIVRYVAHGASLEGELFLALEWLEGQNLRDRLAGGRMELRETLAVVARVADALAAAHRHGVVHRDIKPSNLFLPGGAAERVKILDFGVARLGAEGEPFTRPGTAIGTPGYMAPEQARGDRDVGASADVFALGCVLFECLAGTAAFRGGDHLAILLKVMLEDPPRLGELLEDVPPRLDDLCLRMLSKVRSERPTTGALASELAAIAGEGPPSGAGPRPRALTSVERRMLCLVLGRTAPPAHAEAETLPLSAADAGERTLETVATTHRGKLEYLADGSMLVTLASEGPATDQAARAARCALAIRELLEAPGTPEGRGPSLALCAWRGVAAARSMSEVIERAVGMLDAPGPFGVRIDDVVQGLLDTRFEVRSEGGLSWLTGQREDDHTARRFLGKLTPCVGRERELGNLISIYDECVAEPVCRAVVVTAAAGVGKSRLRHELVRELRRAHQGTAIWTARGDPMGAGSPFGMIAQVVRAAAEIVSSDAPAVMREKLTRRVASRTSSPADVARISAFLAELAGAPIDDDDVAACGAANELRAARFDAIVMGDQIRRAWEDFLAAECASHPVVVVLEDLHWGDAPTVSLVDAALRHLREAPLMVLALGRPEVHDSFPGLWRSHEAIDLRLLDLTRRASERLVRSVLGRAVDEPTVQRLVERAGGNAFYLEELIRAVAEGRGEQLPETVVAMAEARLEALAPEARRTLRAASVFGNVFWREGVVALLAGHREPEDWVVELEAREVVTRRRESRFAGHDELTFRHALVREAAYAMLTDADRALGHRLAGEWLERVGERDPLVLGEHFERGGDPKRAAVWYRRAAEQALEGNDFTGAIATAERTVACGAGEIAPDMLGGLRLLAAEAHTWRGALADASLAAREALDLLPRGSRAWYLAAEQLANACGRIGDVGELVILAEKLLATTTEGPPASGRGDVRGARAIALARTAMVVANAGRYEEADALHAEAERVAAGALDAEALARVEQGRASKALAAGDSGAALEHMNAAGEAFRSAGDLRSACVQDVNIGYTNLLLGNYDRGERALRAALASSERMGLRQAAAAARQNLGSLLALRGSHEEGEALLVESIVSLSAIGDLRLEGASRLYLAIALTRRGELGRAEQEAREAVRVLANVPPSLARALAALSRALRGRGAVDEALESASEALAILDSLGGGGEGEALVRLAHVEALAAAGEADAARAAIGAARRRLLERAGKIADPAVRRRFLSDVEDNARTLELAAELGAADGPALDV